MFIHFQIVSAVFCYGGQATILYVKYYTQFIGINALLFIPFQLVPVSITLYYMNTAGMLM
jgi:hypothetical protein